MKKPLSKHQELLRQVKANHELFGLSNSISQLTLMHNKIMNNDLKKLKMIEHSNSSKIFNLEKVDCRNLLRTASKEIKRVSYQLSTLVTDGQQNVQLFNGSVQELELLDSLPTY